MKKLKRIGILLFIMILMGSLFSVSSAAESAPLQLTLVEGGDGICFALEASEDLYLANYGFEIHYDRDTFQLTEIRNELTDKGGLYQSNVETGRAAAIFGDNITLEKGEAFLTYVFSSREAVEEGSFSFSVSIESAADEDGEDLPWKGSLIETIYPEKPQSVSGDVNGDGRVDCEDAVLLFRHVSGQPIEAETNVLDVNEDGKINNLDAILIFRRAAGQEPQES